MGFFIDMIDVGQGDAFLLTLDADAAEVTVLIDAGTEPQGAKVARFVKDNANGHLSAVVATHLDDDHIGGLVHVVRQCKIQRFFMNLPTQERNALSSVFRKRLLLEQDHAARQRLTASIDTAENLEQALRDAGLEPEPMYVGVNSRFTVGTEIVLNVLNPTEERLQAAWKEVGQRSAATLASDIFRLLEAKAPATSASNNAGIVVELEYKGAPYALMAADVGADVLREVTGGRQYPFLKVSHHGSKTGLDDELAKQLRPSTAYVPVGPNSHGHPAKETLDLLREYGARTYCSQKTDSCRSSCPAGGFGSLCHRMDRETRSGWSNVDSSQCENNR